MPAQDASMIAGTRRLLWVSVVLLLLYGALSIAASTLLPGAIHHWLQARGLDASISQISVSLPRLRAELRGVTARNKSGRGFNARQATIGLSWWKLLRGKIHVKQIELQGVYLDLESAPGKYGRRWEIGGWLLGEGPPQDKNWRVELASARLRDGEVCYQHKPQWPSASCVRFTDIDLQEFFVAARRTGNEPLHFEIGADDLQLRNAVARDRNIATELNSDKTVKKFADTATENFTEKPTVALIDIRARAPQFSLISKKLSARQLELHKFAGCPPKRWADALPALNRIIDHCASAGRLQVNGPMEFTFGENSVVRWRRANGQNIKLRYQNRRWHNWRADTIALNSFEFRRRDQHLSWQSAGASTFDWCPNQWRSADHHYCVRAGGLRLPESVSFDWPKQLQVKGAGGELTQTQLLDVAEHDPAFKSDNPVTANSAQIGAFSYHGENRILQFASINVDGAAGCIPGQLWDRQDHCIQLTALQLSEPLLWYFPMEKSRPGIGFASGAVNLAEFKLNVMRKPAGAGNTSEGRRNSDLDLRDMHWARAKIVPGEMPLLLQDFGLKHLRGCAPDALLAEKIRPLCAQVENLQGQGNFALQTGVNPYAILGELSLDTLQLSDRWPVDSGLRLQKLQAGSGLFRLSGGKHSSGKNSATAGNTQYQQGLDLAFEEDLSIDDSGAEKGLLSQEYPSRGGVAENIESETNSRAGFSLARESGPNSAELELEQIQLGSLDGCLPESWANLIYRDRSNKPECFIVHNLRQHQPLELRWSGGLKLTAAELSLEHALAKTAGGKRLLEINGLRVPKADVNLGVQKQRGRLLLPGFSLDEFYGCLSVGRCVQLHTLRTGENFALRYDPQEFAADFSGLVLSSLQVNGGSAAAESAGERSNQLHAQIKQLMAPGLQVRLPRKEGASASWTMQNVQAQLLDICWPGSAKKSIGDLAQSGMPRCVSAQNLRSHPLDNGSGFVLEQIALRSSPQTPEQLTVGRLKIAQVALVQRENAALHLNLKGLEIDSVDGCGLNQWLPAGARDRGWGGCLVGRKLVLSGDNLIALGTNRSVQKRNETGRKTALLEFGPLQAEQLKLVPESRGDPKMELQQLSWQSLSWLGGLAVQVQELRAQKFSGCLPPGVYATTTASSAVQKRRCLDVEALHLAGSQQLEFDRGLRSTGRIDVRGFSWRENGKQLLGLVQLTLDGLRFNGSELELSRGDASGLSGCLPEFSFGGKPFEPCFKLGRIEMRSQHRLQMSGVKQRQLNNVLVHGLQLTQAGYSANVPAQLLQVELLSADQLIFGNRLLQAKNLQLNGVSSCVPAGFVKRIDHCMTMQTLLASGRYEMSRQELDMSDLQFKQLLIMDNSGTRLLQNELASVQQLHVAKNLLQFLILELAGSKLFRRSEKSIAFTQHEWTSELDTLRINQFNYDAALHYLQINTLDVLRPKIILARSKSGDFGAWSQLSSDSPGEHEPKMSELRKKYLRGQLSREANRFHYRIGEAYLDNGRFVWLDNSEESEARLPVREVNLLMRGISSYTEDPPAIVLLNGHPGGYGELQLAGTIDLQPSQRWDANIYGYIESANLIPATPYIAKLLGYKILQGQLDAILEIKVQHNDVNALVDMELNKIKVRRVRDTDNLAVKKTIIPLNVALLLLRDGQGNVSFDMPITGDLFDPKFSFSFIFSDLLQRAIMEALFSYFTPIGFYSLGRLAWERFRAPNFAPVMFDPGEVELDAQARLELAETVLKMKENPDARPGICSIATALDWQQLYPMSTPGMRGTRAVRENFYRDPPQQIRKELLRLARKRGRHVQELLIDAGLTAKDFIQCAPDYIGHDFDRPRVEISN